MTKLIQNTSKRIISGIEQLISKPHKAIKVIGSHIQNKDLPFIKENWIGNRVHKGQFVNINLSNKRGVKNIMKWRLSPNPQFKEKLFEGWSPSVNIINTIDDIQVDHLIWLGHNSFYMRLNGKRIMFDPVFGAIPFVKRKSKFPAKTSLFKDIDYLLISHDHYDHMDKKSVKIICEQSPNIIILCGIGIEKLIEKWLPNTKIIPMAWYQQFKHDGLKFSFMPALHWSKRKTNDGGKRLWGAFVIQTPIKTIYYSGDTGYCEHFKELPKLFGKIDYALIGIGTYKPRWFLPRNHISPEEAIMASLDMEATTTIPMHYGTFSLSEEPMGDPPKVFKREAIRMNIDYIIPFIGEKVLL